MTMSKVLKPVAPVRDAESASSWREWIVAAVLFGLMLVVGIREGGFWHADASVTAVASVVLLACAVVANPLDRRAASLVLCLVLLAAWWAIRAAQTGALSEFLPLGASMLAFAASFAAVRPLRAQARQVAALGVACLGGAGALVGFAGLIWRWFPMAMPAQGLWRLSTTLTYSDAAGLALGVCLLVALGTDVRPWLVRIAVCLCAAGLLATQSRGAYIAVACACAFVPWRRYARFLVPLLAGVGLGVAAIASSPGSGPVPWLGAAVVVALGISAVPGVDLDRLWRSTGLRTVGVLVLVAGVVATALVLRHEVGLRAFAPSDQDRSAEWAAALHQWASARAFGVGPDRLLVFHAVDGSYAHFAHNEFLQIAADAGAVGLALLLASIVVASRVARRRDVLTSCATAALVCVAVGGLFDFDWHLTFVGLLGGWCAGLTTGTGVPEKEMVGDEEPAQGG